MNTQRAEAAPTQQKHELLRDLSLLLLLRAAATAVAVWLGFSAVSDDDYARVTIAQGFALNPAWDPSGSSWLPFPFWLNGAAMAAFGPTLAVARGVSLVLSGGAVALAYLSARLFSLTREAAFWSAAVVAVLPHAVWLSYATVPAGYSAALCVFALATLGARNLSSDMKLWGGVALFAATLSRYETWAVAAVFAFCCLLRWYRQRRTSDVIAACFALLGPAGWLLGGIIQHDSALFFVKRIAEYRQALGRSPGDWWEVLNNYPLALLRAEPELMSLLFLGFSKNGRALPRGLRTLVLGLAAMFLLLIVGDVRDGAPTHHAERPLLALWLGFALLGGHWLVAAYQNSKLRLVTWLALALLLASFRPLITHRDNFVDRSAELEIGRIAKEVATSGVLVVDSADFGFFATIAAFEAPQRARPLLAHDPRRPEADPWSSGDRLLAAVSARDAQWLIARNANASKAQAVGRSVASTSHFTLVALESPPKVPDQGSGD